MIGQIQQTKAAQKEKVNVNSSNLSEEETGERKVHIRKRNNNENKEE